MLIYAVFEEMGWRVVLPGLRSEPGRRIVWLGFVSLCFGLSHLHGLPGGLVGVVASGLFGFAMAMVREWSRGSLVACVVAHVLADVALLGRFYA